MAPGSAQCCGGRRAVSVPGQGADARPLGRRQAGQTSRLSRRRGGFSSRLAAAAASATPPASSRLVRRPCMNVARLTSSAPNTATARAPPTCRGVEHAASRACPVSRDAVQQDRGHGRHEEASTGLAPHSAAKLASVRSRAGLSPAQARGGSLLDELAPRARCPAGRSRRSAPGGGGPPLYGPDVDRPITHLASGCTFAPPLRPAEGGKPHVGMPE
jgi:hypothetical protein